MRRLLFTAILVFASCSVRTAVGQSPLFAGRVSLSVDQASAGSDITAARYVATSKIPSAVPAAETSMDDGFAGHVAGTDSCCCGEPLRCCIIDSDAPQVLDLFYGYDAWRGVPDGAWTNNGAHAGINLGTKLGSFSEATGLGLQLGGSIGVYDWAGTDYRMDNQNKPTTQGMFTYGLFHRADPDSGWVAALAHDWMLNANYSVMGEDSVLWQWRGQVGHVCDDANEFGIWGTWRGHGETQRVRVFGDVTWRPVQQINAYWHHKWTPGGADTWIMFGAPEKDRLTGGGSLGDFIAGALSRVPINDHLQLYSMVNYMHQSASPGDPGAREESWNFYVGVALYPQPLARSRTVRGHRWAPVLPLANNGLFLVDASHTY